jgi:hypothetical protein
VRHDIPGNFMKSAVTAASRSRTLAASSERSQKIFGVYALIVAEKPKIFSNLSHM